MRWKLPRGRGASSRPWRHRWVLFYSEQTMGHNDLPHPALGYLHLHRGERAAQRRMRGTPA